MINNFKKTVKQTVATFRKCWLPVVGVNIGLFILTFLLTLLVVIILGQNFINAIALLGTNPAAAINFLPQLVVFVLLLLFVFTSFYCAAVWLLFVIKNNALIGKNLFKDAFFEACRKIWKVIVWGIILFVFFLLVGSILGLILDKYFIFLYIPVIMVSIPCIYTISFGLMFLEGSFKDILIQSFNLGLKKWGRILVTYIVGVLIFLICLRISGLMQVIFAKIGFATIGKLVNAVINVFLQAFAYCFFTVFYLNTAGIKVPSKTEQIPQK